MHPIERLRYVARSHGGDQRTLVEETAAALRGLGLDQAGLVVACRRILERHPSSGPLWWLCAHVVAAADPLAAARMSAREIDADPTADRLIDSLPADAAVCVVGWPDLAGEAIIRRGDLRALVIEAEGAAHFVRRLDRSDIAADLVPAAGMAGAVETADVVLVEVLAATPRSLLAASGSRAMAATAYCAGVPAWAVAGRGRRLPAPMFDVLVRRCVDEARPWDSAVETLPVDLCAEIVGPAGRQPAGDAGLGPECPLAAELLRSSAM